ncbi:MAG: glycosyltransferase [Candidatus Moranbacteria bacterium]|nr:glycosyltransferase [Candidatus Moranbacteria bacterium]
MPITNGVIQAQLLPVLLESARLGYATEVLETTGRFDAQEKYRPEMEKKLTETGIVLRKINVPRFTFLPSILYFSLQSHGLLKKQLATSALEPTIIYARNYKFIPFLLWANYFWHIPFIYSPRGAYVAERKHYRKIKDLAYGYFIGLLEKHATQKSFATIVETEQFKKHLAGLYQIDGKNITVIPNYWDASLLPEKNWDRDEMREKLGLSGKKIIVYTGTVEAWYAFEKMVALVAQLRKKDPTIFFQLFLKEDYARTESLKIMQALPEIFEKYGLGKDAYAISSYPPAERYFYLSACDASICLTTTAEFKTMMLYLKIVDFWGAGLPVIANKEIAAVRNVIENSNTGAVVDYADWEESVAKIDPEKLFKKSATYSQEIEKYSSEKVLPLYFNLFEKSFQE